MASMHPDIKRELDNLEIQFPGQSQLNLDEYAALYKIKRQYASQHLRRRGIPVAKEGGRLYISMLDLAEYKAECKAKTQNRLIIKPFDYAEEMKNRRGFSKRRMQI